MSVVTDKTRGVLNIITSILAIGYIWFVLKPATDSMGIALLTIFYFLPLMFLLLITGVVTKSNAKRSSVFQGLLLFLLSLCLIWSLTDGWLEDAVDKARSYHQPQELIFIGILVLLWSIEFYYLLRWMFKKDN